MRGASKIGLGQIFGRWPVVSAVLLCLVFTDCSLLLEPHPIHLHCNAEEHVPADPDLAGCFEHRDGAHIGSIDIVQGECDGIHGFGAGLAPWLPEVDDVWSFSGWVASSEEAGVESRARLNIAPDVSVMVFRRSSGGAEELILRREAVLDDAVLVPCI